MIIKYTEDEFDLAKSNDKLKLECVYCSKDYFKYKKYIVNEIENNKTQIKFCSRECKYKNDSNTKEFFCKNCNLSILKKKSEIKKVKNGNLFCNKSCSAQFNNKNKKIGNRRSKIEIWIENILTKKYDFEILFNDRQTIGSELDIYIPSLKIAFEINGIFHYKPIFGLDKLKNIKYNDIIKSKKCLDMNIKLYVINISKSIVFNERKDYKYLKMIDDVITNAPLA